MDPVALLGAGHLRVNEANAGALDEVIETDSVGAAANTETMSEGVLVMVDGAKTLRWFFIDDTDGGATRIINDCVEEVCVGCRAPDEEGGGVERHFRDRVCDFL